MIAGVKCYYNVVRIKELIIVIDVNHLFYVELRAVIDTDAEH